MAWFYEIRSSNNAVLKRDGGFATQDAAKFVAADTVRLHAINGGHLIHLLIWFDDGRLRVGLQPHQVHSNQFDCGCK